MTEKLKVYNTENEVVGEAFKSDEGKTSITIKDLEPGTTYPKGTFKIVTETKDGVSEYVDVPEFTTKEVKRKTKAQK